MNGVHERQNSLWIDDIKLADLAEHYGTPSYIYSAAHIESQYHALAGAMRKALPANRQPLLCYACKASSNLAILTLLKNLGGGLEIVSEGELRRGLAAGFDPAKIVSTGVGKTRSEIEQCLTAGIRQFNVESLPELERIQSIAAQIDKTATVVFRLNPDISGGGHTKISTGRKQDKFGIEQEAIFEAFARAKTMSHIKAVGLSVHVGSQVFEVETFEKAFNKFPILVKDLRAQGHAIATLDIGGGFPIQYRGEKLLDLSAYANWVRDIILPLDTSIIMEPGRYLIGNAGVLLTRAEHVKQTSSRAFIVLDAAMNDLIRPMLYDAYHAIEPVERRDAPLRIYDIVGPVCETGDTFARQREMPEIQEGDLIAIRSAGAYGFCMASNYNTRRMPPEILVKGEHHAAIRERQTYADLLERDIVPGWLDENR